MVDFHAPIAAPKSLGVRWRDVPAGASARDHSHARAALEVVRDRRCVPVVPTPLQRVRLLAPGRIDQGSIGVPATARHNCLAAQV